MVFPKMEDKLSSLFQSKIGASVYRKAKETISKYNMLPMIKEGVLVGLSGGADSVMLLLFLLEYRKEVGNFDLLAVHVNHGIRGDEAKRDELFSYELARSLGVELLSFEIDVPSISKKTGLGLEETARKERYSCFDNIIRSRNDIKTVAVAHNATDNLETVIFNLMRGAGTLGLAGIPAVRENIIRPLISVSKNDILSALDGCGVRYVFDSTNDSCDYSRNRIRNRILPELKQLTKSPEEMAGRASELLRSDCEFIQLEAEAFLKKCNRSISKDALLALHPAVFGRVIKKMCEDSGCCGIEHIHIMKIRELLARDNFSVSLPSGFRFVCEYGKCNLRCEESSGQFLVHLSLGENKLDEYGTVVILSHKKDVEFSRNVHKIAIQERISSDIIVGDIYVRSKNDGDSYRYGGHTHKLKKMLSDRKIPRSFRDRIPVFCDSLGIFWVPGFSVRDGVKSDKYLYITILTANECDNNAFYIPTRQNNG